MGGEDQANSLRQIVRSGLTENMAVGGALFELESIRRSRCGVDRLVDDGMVVG